MQKNKKDIQKNAFNDLFNITSKDTIPTPIIENREEKETKEDIIVKKETNIITKRRTFNIPIDILEDMEKVLYIDRDIKNNTELLIKALRDFLNSKNCKEQIEEYDKIKGNNNK